MESMKTKTRSKFLAKTIPVLLTALLFLTACQKPLTKAEKKEQAKETVTFFFHGYGSNINAENTWLKRPDRQVRAMRF
jgi:type III secretory pathway lipoprotein EscJ